MRFLIIVAALVALAGCTDAAAEARNKYLEALERHGECVKANPSVPESCTELLHEMEAKESDYIRLLAGRR